MTLTIEVPSGYKKVKWADVEDGDIVYILGSRFENANWVSCAYGPHQVVNVRKRQCKNSAKGFFFFHSAEDLLVKE